MPVREKMLVQQGIRQLFSSGKDREATEILVDHIMLVSPGAQRGRIWHDKWKPYFDESGKLQNWNLSGMRISKLPPSFNALVCSGYLNLSGNKLMSLPEGFSDITVGENLYLKYNPQLIGGPENFPNVKGTVYR